MPKPVEVEKVTSFPLNNPDSVTVGTEKVPTISLPKPTPVPETKPVRVPNPSKGENYPSPG